MAPRIKLPCRKRTRKTCRDARKSCVYISSTDGKNYCKKRRGTRKRRHKATTRGSRNTPFLAKKPNMEAIYLAAKFDNSPASSRTHMFQPNAPADFFDKPGVKPVIIDADTISEPIEGVVVNKEPKFKLSNHNSAIGIM